MIWGPLVVMVTVDVAGTPLIGKPLAPFGYENEHTGGIATSGVIVEHDNVIPVCTPLM